ncbi:MAG: hypothetical protein ACI97A_000181 [Planctomycetota bacterium]|jgi:hypothetical protein
MKAQMKRLMLPALIVALMAAALPVGAWGQTPAEREQTDANEAKRALIKNIPEPTDPEAIAGTYQLDGETIKVTAGEHYDLLVLLNQMEGSARRPIRSDDAWVHILLNAWADFLDIQVPPIELENRMQRDNPAVYQGLIRRWNAIGVSPESGEYYETCRLKINHLKNLLFNSNRTTTRDAFDQFKIRKLQYRFEYACFQNKDYVQQLADKGVSKEVLAQFWKDDRSAAARYRLPANVSGGIVYFDPANFTKEMTASLGNEKKVTRKQALAYFKANQKRMMGSIKPDQRHLLEVKADTKIEDLVSPFSLVKDEIYKKLTLQHLIVDAHKEARQAGAKADLEQIAKKYNLAYHKIDKMDRRGAMAELKEFGIPAFSQLFAAPVGRISTQLSVVGDRRFFYFVGAKEQSRLPELDTVIDEVRDFYLEARSSELAREEAKNLLEEMNAKVAELIAPEKARLEKEAEETANREIAQMNLANENDKKRALARAKGRTRLPLDKLRKSLLPEIFAEIVKRRKVKMLVTPYFEFSVSREDRSSIQDPNESRMAFLSASYQVRALEKGGVTGMILEDHLTRSYMIGRLVDKRDPELNTMGPVDLIQARGQVQQISQARFPRRFRFEELKEQFGFKATN